MNTTPFRFVLIALLMLLLFSYPMLSAANKNSTFAGVPVLYLYIGMVWLLSVTVLCITALNTKRK